MSTNRKFRRRAERARESVKCSRCGRTQQQVPGEWNVTFVHGVATGYTCPDDQSAEENAEAVINDATGGSIIGKVAAPGDLGPAAAAEHLLRVASDVWVDWLQTIGDDGGAAAPDPYALAGRTLDRVAGTIGRPVGADYAARMRDTLAGTFRDWYAEGAS